MTKPSNTKSSSTVPLPKLERLLLDADVNVELELLLKAIGFCTQFVLRVDANVRSDVSILRWARRHRYILVCHDKFRDKQTRIELYPELYKKGGRIIQIGGGPQQDPYKALGKLLVHRDTWVKWFNDHDGIVIVHSQGCRLNDASKLYTIVQKKMPLEIEPVHTLRHRERLERQGKRYLRNILPEQKRLLD